MSAGDVERFRQRVLAAGADIPDEIVPVVATLAGPLVMQQEALTRLDLGDVEPFVPALRLPADAA
jgi:hypothetical protein